MLDEAIETGAIVVSRDEFKDLYEVCNQYNKVIGCLSEAYLLRNG